MVQLFENSKEHCLAGKEVCLDSILPYFWFQARQLNQLEYPSFCKRYVLLNRSSETPSQQILPVQESSSIWKRVTEDVAKIEVCQKNTDEPEEVNQVIPKKLKLECITDEHTFRVQPMEVARVKNRIRNALGNSVDKIVLTISKFLDGLIHPDIVEESVGDLLEENYRLKESKKNQIVRFYKCSLMAINICISSVRLSIQDCVDKDKPHSKFFMPRIFYSLTPEESDYSRKKAYPRRDDFPWKVSDPTTVIKLSQVARRRTRNLWLFPQVRFLITKPSRTWWKRYGWLIISLLLTTTSTFLPMMLLQFWSTQKTDDTGVNALERIASFR
jgi:hypothetical protein